MLKSCAFRTCEEAGWNRVLPIEKDGGGAAVLTMEMGCRKLSENFGAFSEDNQQFVENLKTWILLQQKLGGWGFLLKNLPF